LNIASFGVLKITLQLAYSAGDDISQGSVATRLGCNDVDANLLHNASVTEFWK